MGSPPEPAVLAYRKLTMPRKHPQVLLGANLNMRPYAHKTRILGAQRLTKG